MKSLSKNLVEYVYNNQCFPRDSCSFKQINLDTIVCMPEYKPDIEQLIKVASEVKINHTKIINTPKGQSLEGNVLTGKKAIIEGSVEQKIQYIACEESQSIHVVSFSTPFLTYVVIPETIGCCADDLVATGFVEDVMTYQEDCRSIYINNTLFIAIETC